MTIQNNYKIGAISSFGRARPWHGRGDRSEPGMVHNLKNPVSHETYQKNFKIVFMKFGGVPEWLKGVVPKTTIPLQVSEVRILPPPPVGKSEVWLALCEGSPADFEAEIKFFVFQNKVRADIF